METVWGISQFCNIRSIKRQIYRVEVRRKYMASRDVKEERGRMFGRIDRSIL